MPQHEVISLDSDDDEPAPVAPAPRSDKGTSRDAPVELLDSDDDAPAAARSAGSSGSSSGGGGARPTNGGSGRQHGGGGGGDGGAASSSSVNLMAESVQLPMKSLPSWQRRQFSFVADTSMRQMPERTDGVGAAFGSWQTAGGGPCRTGWLMVPSIATLPGAERRQLLRELEEANPPITREADEQLMMGKLAYKFAEARRLRALFGTVPDGPPVRDAPAPPPPPPLQESDVLQGEWSSWG